MTERIITITEARYLLKNLADHALEETLVITHNDLPLLTLMPHQAYRELLANVESLQTVLEIMLGSTITEHPRPQRAEKPAQVGDKSTSWEEFKAEVGWE